MATGNQLNWRGPQVARTVMDAMYAGLLKANTYLWNDIRRSVSVSGRASGGGARSPVKGAPPPMKVYHSRPGDPPHKDTGDNVEKRIIPSHDQATMTTAVCIDSLVGIYLELGVRGGVAISSTRKQCMVFPGWVEQVAGGGKGARSAWSWVFAKQVIQGPIAPRPFMRPAIPRNANMLCLIAMNEAARRIGSISPLEGQRLTISSQIGGQ